MCMLYRWEKIKGCGMHDDKQYLHLSAELCLSFDVVDREEET